MSADERLAVLVAAASPDDGMVVVTRATGHGGRTFLDTGRAFVDARPSGRALAATHLELDAPRSLAARAAPSPLLRAVRPVVELRSETAAPYAWIASSDEPVVVVPRRGRAVVRTPARVAKWAERRDAPAREAAAIERLAPAARAAGFDVPAAQLRELGAAAALVLDAAPGRTLATTLRRRPARLARSADRVVSTLEAWNLRAARRAPLGSTGAARTLEGDLAVVAGHVADDDLRRARDLLRTHGDTVVPVAPAHGDVTMWNLLLDDGRLALVDWEAALDEQLPGFDAEYALVDAVAAAHGYRDRVAAWRAAHGLDPVALPLLRRRIAATTGLADDAAPLVAVSCWAHHAANELRKNGGDGSFLEILRLTLRELG